MFLTSYIFKSIEKHKIDLKATSIKQSLENISQLPSAFHKVLLFLQMPFQFQISMLMHQTDFKEFSFMMTIFTFKNGLIGKRMRQEDNMLEVVLKDLVYLKYVGL